MNGNIDSSVVDLFMARVTAQIVCHDPALVGGGLHKTIALIVREALEAGFAEGSSDLNFAVNEYFDGRMADYPSSPPRMEA